MKVPLFLYLVFALPCTGISQTYLTLKIGAHKSIFDGMDDYETFGYFHDARPVYANVDSQLYKGSILKRYGPEIGMDFSAGLTQKIKKRINVGLAMGFRMFRNIQFRYTGKSENYPYEVLPPNKNTYETYTFRDQFVTLTPSIQWVVNKYIALEFSPDIWKRESARYSTELSFIGTSEWGGFIVTKSNADNKDYGIILNGSIVFYPDKLFSFVIEHSRFLTAINKETQIEKNFYTSWSAKLMLNIELRRK